jgi:poly(3-hydroxybutyrate) depolymerase
MSSARTRSTCLALTAALAASACAQRSAAPPPSPAPTTTTTAPTPSPAAAAPAARGSAGCGHPGPIAGERIMTTQGLTTPFIVSLPPRYDPGRAYPLVFGFHGFQRNHQHCREDDCGGLHDATAKEAIVVYPKSIGPGWEQGENRNRNVQYFQELLALIEGQYCVDLDRVVLAGTSSGATFVNILACRAGDSFTVGAPVAGSLDDGERAACKTVPAMIVVHGVRDHLARGEGVRDYFAQKSGCSAETSPPLLPMHERLMAASAAGREEIACVEYQGCRGRRVVWCEHSFGGYNGATHGWPPAASPFIWDFLRAQK